MDHREPHVLALRRARHPHRGLAQQSPQPWIAPPASAAGAGAGIVADGPKGRSVPRFAGAKAIR